jgi:RNA-directed DNA polymerase
MSGTLGPEGISTGLQRVAELSRKAPGMVWSTLSHHITLDLLKEAYRLTRKDGAVGIDGQTAKEYEEKLEGNLRSLLERLKSGTYQAPPVKRVYIPKGDGTRTRPIGIPTFEDKVLQRAVVMVLEAVYEQDFLDCSYGFRPGRSAHQALKAVWDELMRESGGFVLELDIQKYFDTIDHELLRSILDKRVRDGVLRRVINKWLKAGVMEEGQIHHPEGGTPQGGVISPLLANLFLHEVLDKWFEGEVKPRLSGRAVLVRFADDALMVFSSEEDARRVLAVLPKRFGKYRLSLHPEKTRLIDFRRPGQSKSDQRATEERGPGVFDLLGFTHYWGRTRRGGWAVKRKTAKDRFGRALKRVAEWCRVNRHLPVRAQHQGLTLKLRGHFQYYGIIGNSHALKRFLFEVTRVWHKWLNRRSQRGNMPWDRFNRLLDRYSLPYPRSFHPAVC